MDPRFGSVASRAAPAEVAWRYSRSVLFGGRAKWLPPYRLVPSFASADGQTAVYRRRSQIVLTDDSDNTQVAHDATVKLDGNEYKVRIDQYRRADGRRRARRTPRRTRTSARSRPTRCASRSTGT